MNFERVNMKYKIAMLAGVLFFSGCVENGINLKVITGEKKSEVPKWLDNPQSESGGKITAVGCAGHHFKGKAAQKKLAVSRAIDEIATQVKVTVNNVSLRKRTNNSSSSSSTSLQSVDGVSVGTEIVDYYTKQNGDICAWVIKR